MTTPETEQELAEALRDARRYRAFSLMLTANPEGEFAMRVQDRLEAAGPSPLDSSDQPTKEAIDKFVDSLADTMDIVAQEMHDAGISERP